MTARSFGVLCLLPLLIFSLAFLALPLVRLVLSSSEGADGWSVYIRMLQTPRYLSALLQTLLSRAL